MHKNNIFTISGHPCTHLGITFSILGENNNYSHFDTLPLNIEIVGPPQKYETVNGTFVDGSESFSGGHV